MPYATRDHRHFDAAYVAATAEPGENTNTGRALLPSRLRGRDARSLSPAQSKVLLTTLTQCTSAKGTIYMRGWLGASNLVAFRGEDDEQGRVTWQVFLSERQPKDGAPGRP